MEMEDTQSPGMVSHVQSRIEEYRDSAIENLMRVTGPLSGEAVESTLDDIASLVLYLDNFPYAKYRLE